MRQRASSESARTIVRRDGAAAHSPRRLVAGARTTEGVPGASPFLQGCSTERFNRGAGSFWRAAMPAGAAPFAEGGHKLSLNQSTVSERQAPFAVGGCMECLSQGPGSQIPAPFRQGGFAECLNQGAGSPRQAPIAEGGRTEARCTGAESSRCTRLTANHLAQPQGSMPQSSPTPIRP